MTRVVVIVPAYNEGQRIAATVAAARAIKGVTEVVVADDASADETARYAEAAGARVVRLSQNRGKGAALDAGLAEAKASGPLDVALLLDGDLGESASQGGLLLAPVLAGEADMSIARFPRLTSKAGFGLVMRFARWGIRRLGGPFDATAPLSGQRALSSRAIEAATPFAGGFGVEVALTVRTLRAGLHVVEIDTTMTHAATGRDVAGFVHRGRQFIHVGRTLLALALERRR